ncbi:MAG: HD domain-containing protein [Verrucomicrobiota bacterium]
MEVVTIRELKQRACEVPGEYGVRAQVSAVVQKTTRAGKPFYEVRLADAEDHYVLRAWNDTPGYEVAAGLDAGVFVEVSGQWVDAGDFGVEAKRWEVRELTKEEVAGVLAGGDELARRQAEDYAFILERVTSMKDGRLAGVSGLFLEKYGERFRRAGAARGYHHARRGGLVEHVAQMMRCALGVCGAYPDLNEDLVLAGVLFHDSGKLWENCFLEDGFVMPYSESGELLGHIAIGMELVNKLWRDLMESDEAKGWEDLRPKSEEVRLHLLHLIASHHGTHEFGSPVVPKTPEAYVLHHVDNIDAKMEMFAGGYETAALLAPNIFDRVRPLPGNLVRPLGKVGEEAAE